ncbi:LysR family transcriptional regulator protein [Ketogulonicigenium robustum]|uniref:LysR family transcriptional regulator protein n=1 Tax=Ketogulonicigenium robustum TaxID=92947 RepID=A0A1W6P1C7_9RHOB|nr:hydrogen peroxide-inducible genes activator [Ketogulonicigenium robustum]ARO15244.1 LysR family transcriptional regulator protein [Ketogulonicigenium robustum]
MKALTIKHLRYFAALARHHHFGRAAEVCAISQPALSLQIKELETIVGAPLLERGPRQLHLTALGEEFAARAAQILQAMDDLGELARAASGDMAGRLRLGIIPTVTPYLLPRLMTALTRRYPALDLQPRETVTRRLLDDLHAGTLDAAVVALPVSEPQLHEEPLFDEDFVLVRPVTDADRPVPSAAMLREMRLLLLEEGHCFRDQALSFCSLDTTHARDLMEASSLATLVQMVSAGIGVTLIPEMAVAVETRGAAVSVARLAHPAPTRRIGLVWRKSSPLAGQLGQFAALIRQTWAQQKGGA